MLQKLFRALNFTKKFDGLLIERQEPCRICGTKHALKISETDFWDLQHCSIVKCNVCNNIQLDPMLTDESTALGCYAYHINEMLRVSQKEQKRNLIRNYRRGILFANQLKRLGFSPKEILEFGSGSGYFASGIQFIFPDSKITVVDIVDDVLKRNKEIHNFDGIKGTPENTEEIGKRKYDLIIARDIIEHVTDISKMIKNVSQLLNENGMFHFLTPNGHEDVWGHYLRWKISHRPSELLINHVNYFDGKGLLDLMKKNLLLPIRYYTYQIKSTIRGKGWSKKSSRAQKLSEKVSAMAEVNNKENLLSDINFDKNEVLNHWYISKRHKWITLMYSWYHHHWIFKLSPQLNIGHEIYGLFIKSSSNLKEYRFD